MDKLFLKLEDGSRKLSFYRRKDKSVFLDQIDEDTNFTQKLELPDPDKFIKTLKDMGYKEVDA